MTFEAGSQQSHATMRAVPVRQEYQLHGRDDGALQSAINRRYAGMTAPSAVTEGRQPAHFIAQPKHERIGSFWLTRAARMG